MTEHLLSLDSLGRDGVREILDLSHRFKREPGRHREALAGGRVGMIFDKPSTPPWARSPAMIPDKTSPVPA